jgi:hypothetical protein
LTQKANKPTPCKAQLARQIPSVCFPGLTMHHKAFETAPLALLSNQLRKGIDPLYGREGDGCEHFQVDATSCNPQVPHRNPKLKYEALLNGIVVTGFQLRACAISQGLGLTLQSCAQAHGSTQCITDHSHIERYKARLTRRVRSKTLVT